MNATEPSCGPAETDESPRLNGLALSEAYFAEYGMPMLREKFPELLPFVAAGLFGSGSECFGFDDGISRDHDFEPGFILLLPGEDVIDRKREFTLERAYAALPKEYAGVIQDRQTRSAWR